MILYFSGTGNSSHVAEKIQSLTQDQLISINELMKIEIGGVFDSEMPFVFVSPTYAWRLPRVVESFIKNSTFTGNKKAYFVMTCGADIGNAEKYIQTLCEELSLTFMGVRPVVMPDNYITMYPIPPKGEITEMIQRAQPVIEKISERVISGQPFESEQLSFTDHLKSGVVNKAFYSIFVNAKGYYATNDCINCGKCVLICPLNNIHMENGKPKWENHCTQCMACICACPVTAIEYKNKTQGKIRYWCPNGNELE